MDVNTGEQRGERRKEMSFKLNKVGSDWARF